MRLHEALNDGECRRKAEERGGRRGWGGVGRGLFAFYLCPGPISFVVHSDNACAVNVVTIIQLNMRHADWVPMQDTNLGDVDPHDLGWQNICHMAPSEG